MDKVIKEMVEKGVIDPSEVPFDESENEFKEETENKFELPHTIKLKHPIEFDNRKIEEITFKNMCTVEMILHLHMNLGHQYGHYVKPVSQMTGEAEAVIKKLAPTDFVDCVEVVTNFFI